MSKLKRKAGLRPVPVVTGALRHRRRNQRRQGLMTCSAVRLNVSGLPSWMTEGEARATYG